MIHKLKTLPEYLEEVANGRKTFEVRKDDREPPYALGDSLLMEGYQEGRYTGHWVRASVGYILRNDYCIDGYCIMSIKVEASGFAPQTNGDLIRRSNQALAEFIIAGQRQDPSAKWCRSEECARMLEIDPDSFDCTDERQMVCIMRWLDELAGEAVEP